jgi:hypothetical protein
MQAKAAVVYGLGTQSPLCLYSKATGLYAAGQCKPKKLRGLAANGEFAALNGTTVAEASAEPDQRHGAGHRPSSLCLEESLTDQKRLRSCLQWQGGRIST